MKEKVVEMNREFDKVEGSSWIDLVEIKNMKRLSQCEKHFPDHIQQK